jgi:hypothetical protein
VESRELNQSLPSRDSVRAQDIVVPFSRVAKGMRREEITVNHDYQRSDQVWPQLARSYLIDTIIKGFPIAKLYLYQVTDVKSRKTRKEIVDGQQRSTAIYGFYNDEFRLAKSADNEDIKGKKYSELGEEYQQKFLDYSINVDLFIAATPSEVVEVFRRMNSYTVPLNAEEQRHASYQGKFKWFINEVADRLETIFLDTGVFKENSWSEWETISCSPNWLTHF